MSTPTLVKRSPASRESPRSRREWRPAAPCRARPRRGELVVRTSAVFSPCCCAPGDGLDVVADHPRHLRVGVESLERRGEIWGARLPDHRRLHLGRVLQAGDEAAESRSGPRESATSGSCAGCRARRPAPAPRMPARGSCTRRRGSSPRSRPRRPGAPRRRPRPRAGRHPDPRAPQAIVSARTRLPASADRPRSRSSGARRPPARSPSTAAPRRATGSTAWCCS